MTGIVVPTVGESITEVGISKLIVAEGEFVQKDAPIFEIESEKASMEVLASISGKVHYTVKVGDTVKVGTTVCTIEASDAPSQKVEEKKVTEKPITFGQGVRQSADQFIQELQKKPEAPKPLPIARDEQRREPLSKLRKTIAKRLVQVKNETAMLTTFNEVDLSEIVAIRNKEKENFHKKHGVKLTYLPFFVKAALSALKAFPNVNAFIDGDDIVYNPHAHIGIAVSTETGLVVPVIKNSNTLTFVEIAKAIQEFAVKARDRKLTVNDMAGGTFTITNGGTFGSMLSTPILNPPQSAILGMHNIVDRPVAINGQVVIRPIMYLALSYDHRIIDGKESVSFLVHIKEMLESPLKFLLEE